MLRLREKLKYMALGALIALAGFVLGVTGRQGNAGASLTIGTEGGGVTIFSAAGKGGAALSIVEGDGVVFTRDRLGNVAGLD